MPHDPNVEVLVDAALAQLRERMLRELADGTATHGTLDQIVSSINVEHEQIGPNRYIANLGILFDRARAAQFLGVEGGEVQR